MLAEETSNLAALEGPYVVLGMHKSGTTLVAQLLHESGIPMIDDKDLNSDLSYDRGQKYERNSAKLANRRLLHESTQDSIDWYRTRHLEIDQPALSEFVAQIHASVPVDQVWGFKDPRTCLTIKYWQSILPGTTRYIWVIRNPFTVVEHYLRKQHKLPAALSDSISKLRRLPRLYSFCKRILTAYAVLSCWTNHNNGILAALHGQQYTFICYEEFMLNEAAVSRLSNQLGLALKDVRNADLQRSRSQTRISIWIAELLMLARHRTSTLLLYKRCIRTHQQA